MSNLAKNIIINQDERKNFDEFNDEDSWWIDDDNQIQKRIFVGGMLIF